MSVQWGPWKEVGMAAQKGTVERLRASGVGSLTNAFGMAALAGCLQSLPSTTIVAQPMRWAVYLKQYPKVPPFLSRFASEAGRWLLAKDGLYIYRYICIYTYTYTISPVFNVFVGS